MSLAQEKVGVIDIASNFDLGDSLSYIDQNGFWVDIPSGIAGAANLAFILLLGTAAITMLILIGIEIITNGVDGILGAFNRGVEVTQVDQLVAPIVDAIEGGAANLPEIALRRKQAPHHSANRRRR